MLFEVECAVCSSVRAGLLLAHSWLVGCCLAIGLPSATALPPSCLMTQIIIA